MAGLFGRRKAGKEQAPPGKAKKQKASPGKADKKRTKDEEDAFDYEPYKEAQEPDADGPTDDTDEDVRGGPMPETAALTEDGTDAEGDDFFSRWDSEPAESEEDGCLSTDYVLDDDPDESPVYEARSENNDGFSMDFCLDEDPDESPSDTVPSEEEYGGADEDPFAGLDEDEYDPAPKADRQEATPKSPDEDECSPILSMDELEGHAGTNSKGNAPGKKFRKDKGKPVKEREPMSEEKRQFIFTAGLATAAICSIVFVLFGAVFAYRMFRPQLSNAYAWQGGGDGNIYYDSGGRMHVNVYVTKTPDTEITLYMLPDGTVTTEKPADGTPAVPKVFYVDSEGNLSETKPSQADPDESGSSETDSQPTAEPGSESSEGDGTEEGSSESVESSAQATPVPEEDDEGTDPSEDASGDGESGEVKGTSTGGKPQGGAAGAAGDGGSGTGEGGGAVSGTPSGGKPAGNGASGSDGNPSGGAGNQTGGQQGGGSEDTGEGTGADSSSASGENGTEGASGTGSGTAAQAGSENPYKGMTEEEILKAAQERRDAGKGMYLDTDKVYKVQAGDTLSKLSGKLGFSVDFLAAYNGLNSKDMIHAGESLRYPSLD